MSGGFGNPGPPGDPAANEAAEALASTVATDGSADPGDPAQVVTSTALDLLASAVGTSAPLAGAPAIVVRTAPESAMNLVTAAPPDGAIGQAVYIVGSGPPRNDRDGTGRLVVVEDSAAAALGELQLIGVQAEAAATSLASIDGKAPALIGGRVPVETELDAAGPLATEAKQDAANVVRDSILAAVLAALGPYARTTFGQIRVAMRETQFDNVQEYGLDTRAWGTQTATGGTVTFNTATGMTDLAVTSSSGSSAKLRTNTHFIYQPGAVTRVILTIAHGSAGQVNQVRRWGFFNDSDGIFFELNGSDLRLVRRTSTSGSPVDNVLSSTSWDNPSGAPTLTFGNRFEIDLQWLSFGTVRCWINGTLIHTFEFANTLPLPYTRTAQLPISLEVVNTGASTAATLSYVCSTVYLDGGTTLRFVPRERALSAPKTGIGTTYAPLIGLRMASAVAGRTNRKIVIPTRSRVANASGRATVAVILNPSSTTGGTWTQADPTSGVEYNEGITSFVGGTELSRIFLPNTADSRELDGESSFALNGLHLRRDAFNTTGDTVLFVGKADVGTADIDIVARWKELG